MYQIEVIKTKRIEKTNPNTYEVEYEHVADFNNRSANIVPTKEIAYEIALEMTVFENVEHVFVRLMNSAKYVHSSDIYLKYEYDHLLLDDHGESGKLILTHTTIQFDWKNN